ncbi:MAG TPA: TlpA disulfide reductase family protein [Burkholderiaceae bacterium]|nr:TlpA disulfide reductase family protein [Burkholderiaceae bacterium]
MNRRRLALAGVAVVAAATGAGVAWRRRLAPEASAPADWWTLRFERPEGGTLALDAFRGRPLLVNFWATWCPPCVKEMPLLDGFHRGQAAGQGWQVVGLAVDQRAPVQTFLAQHPVTFPIGLVGMDGIELAQRLGNRGGGLPFSALFDRHGVAMQRKLGALEPDDLARWAQLPA